MWEGKVLSGEDPLPAQASERCLNRALRAPGASLPRELFPPSCPPGVALWVKAIISRKFLLIACSRLMGPYHITTFSWMNHTGCLKLGPRGHFHPISLSILSPLCDFSSRLFQVLLLNSLSNLGFVLTAQLPHKRGVQSSSSCAQEPFLSPTAYRTEPRLLKLCVGRSHKSVPCP